MQQPPDQRSIDSLRTRRTQPALPGMTQPTVILSPATPRPATPVRRSRNAWRTVLRLSLFALLLEILLLALFPLLARITQAGDAGQQVAQSLPGLFPWLPSLYWTTRFPALVHLLAPVAWLDLSKPVTGTTAFVSFLFLTIATIVSLLAARLAGGVIQERLSRSDKTLLFWFIVLTTSIFGLTLLFIPIGLTVFSQDMLTYGLYGHTVALQRLNPYGSLPNPQDMLQVLVHAKTTTPYGPVWTDISVLLALIAKDSIASTILVFRCLGFFTHIVNVILLWAILTRLKPEMRLWGTLLYAWNPLVLLFGVAQMHQDIVLLCLLLTAILFFQRNSPTIGWVFVLLASLINFLWLPLLPLFFRFMVRQSRIMRAGPRLLWWAGMLVLSLVVVVLAYAPYWHAIGIPGLVSQLQHTFLQGTAVNSLDAALIHLALTPSWPTTPHIWSLLVLSLTGLLLLLGLWLADSLELVALFGSWVLLILSTLLPTYWPWFLIAPLVLALCSTNSRTILLTILLSVASLLSYYWILTSTWNGQALVTVGLPLLLWGWILFFGSTWQMTHGQQEERPVEVRVQRFIDRSRPNWFSRPSRPGRF